MTLFTPSPLDIEHSCSKRELQRGSRPVGFAALFTTKARDRPAVEALVEAGFEEGRAADRATPMLEAPARRGASPAAPNCPAAVWTGRASRALRGCGPAGPWGERHVQRMPEAVSEGVFGAREPLRRQRRQIKNRSLARRNPRRQSFPREQLAPRWELDCSHSAAQDRCGAAPPRMGAGRFLSHTDVTFAQTFTTSAPCRRRHRP